MDRRATLETWVRESCFSARLYAVQRLEKTVRYDWTMPHKLDHCNAGLLIDLNQREGVRPDKLVLDAGHRKQREATD